MRSLNLSWLQMLYTPHRVTSRVLAKRPSHRLMLSLRRAQGFALITLVLGTISQVGIAVFVSISPELVSSPFVTEVRLLALFGIGISFGSFIVSSRKALWGLFGLRVLTVVALLGALRDGSAMLQLMAVLPSTIEATTYERYRVATVLNGIVLAYFALLVLSPLDAQPDPATIGAVAGACFVAVIYLLAQFYREALVEHSRRIVNLEQAFQQLTDSNLGLQLYASTAETESAGRERTRITRELHDSVGYALTNIGMMMKAARVLMECDQQKLAQMIDETQTTANEALREARRILYRLRSVDDETYQGIWAISRLVKAYRLATDVDVEVHYGNLEWSLGRQIDRAFYRLVQEALTNAYRHGGATKVRITMWMGNDEVVLQVWDNGRGAQVVNEGIGLAGMRERMREIGGALSAGNTPDGFEVTARMPWRDGSPE
ncbi:MAG: sensor histidine kinase [Spirochaetaceae bacterium]|nr:MAG: sensor histidine kinase [Spirochaetaceae bacterium]